MLLRKDHGYCLSYISLTHKIPIQIVKEAELILAFELAGNDSTNYNFVSRQVDPERLTLSILQVICDRFGRKVDFSEFIKRTGLNQLLIEYTTKQMTLKYANGIMPANVTPSITCTNLLGPNYEF